MNREQELEAIKRVDIREVLSCFGIQCRGEMFPATWRQEKHPSVHILRDTKTGAWVWHDHGPGESGTNIDLVKRLSGWTYIQAVRYLRTRFLLGRECPAAPIPAPVTVRHASTATWQIIADEPVTPRFGVELIQYRGLTPRDSKRVGIRSLRIRHSQKTHLKIWVCGFPLLLGGWACFQPRPKTDGGFKTVVPPNGIGWVAGQENRLIIAESICDAVAAQKLCGTAKNPLDADLLIAPVKLAARAGRAIMKRLDKKGPYERIINALDNDLGGEKAGEIIGSIIRDALGPVERLSMSRKDPCEEFVCRGRKKHVPRR